MGTPERGFSDKKTRDKIKGMMGDGMKSILIRDVAGRIETVYEAALNVDIGEACLRTTLKYEDGAGGTSRNVIAQEEEVVAWPGYEILSPGAGNDITNLP